MGRSGVKPLDGHGLPVEGKNPALVAHPHLRAGDQVVAPSTEGRQIVQSLAAEPGIGAMVNLEVGSGAAGPTSVVPGKRRLAHLLPVQRVRMWPGGAMADLLQRERLSGRRSVTSGRDSIHASKASSRTP